MVILFIDSCTQGDIQSASILPCSYISMYLFPRTPMYLFSYASMSPCPFELSPQMKAPRTIYQLESMEEEGEFVRLDQATGSQELLNLIALFLNGSTPELEHRMAMYHPDQYLAILANRQQPRDVLVTCVSVFKQALSKRRNEFQYTFQTVLGSVEALFLSGSEDLCNLLEIVLETLFEEYLDDEKKLQAFEGVADRLAASNDIRQSEINKRALRICLLLVRKMAGPTLNNEVCVGGLLCYLKQLYYHKHKSNQPYDPNGRGCELLLEAMGAEVLQPEQRAFLVMQTNAVRLLTEITQKVEEEEQEETVIPSLYMRNSREIQTLFTMILCTTGSSHIYGLNDTVNEFKAVVLQLFSDTYMYHIHQQLLMKAISTITTSRPLQLTDHSMDIVTSLMLLVERSTSYPDYAKIFFNFTQVLVLKLFEFIAAKEAEKDAMQNDPEHFAEIADDFCKTQDSESLKARAGSLIYNLCMYIDGNLTFVTNFAFVAMLDLERRATLALSAEASMRPGVASSEAPMKTMLDLWDFDAESLTETSILVISSISDMLSRRPDFDRNLRQHLAVVLGLFAAREKVLSVVPVMVVSRYIQLVSYFSSPGCLDPFVLLFDVHPALAQMLLKALETVIQFHDKKVPEMRNYVAGISARILLLSDRLTPLLENTIVSRPELLLCVKERLVERLVLWLLDYINQGNVFSGNKIANLLCKVIEQYPLYMARSEEALFQFELETLAQYLLPLYKQLTSGENTAIEECVVDVAVAHADIIKTGLTPQIAADFLRLGVAVVDRNAGVLNKCLELFSQLLGVLHMKQFFVKEEYVELRKVHVQVGRQLLPRMQEWGRAIELRDDNVWQLACLAEIILGTFEAMPPTLDKASLDLYWLFELCYKCRSPVVQIKASLVCFLLMKLDPSPHLEGWISEKPLSTKIPPTEKEPLCVYILRSLNNFNSPETRVRLLLYALELMMPSESLRKHFSTYEDRIHVLGSRTDECQLFAFQATKDVRHPLMCWPTDVFQELKTMYEGQRDWAHMRVYLSSDDQKRMSAALSMRMVGPHARKILKVRIPPL